MKIENILETIESRNYEPKVVYSQLKNEEIIAEANARAIDLDAIENAMYAVMDQYDQRIFGLQWKRKLMAAIDSYSPGGNTFAAMRLSC